MWRGCRRRWAVRSLRIGRRRVRRRCGGSRRRGRSWWGRRTWISLRRGWWGRVRRLGRRRIRLMGDIFRAGRARDRRGGGGGGGGGFGVGEVVGGGGGGGGGGCINVGGVG